LSGEILRVSGDGGILTLGDAQVYEVKNIAKGGNILLGVFPYLRL
jgi:hypothetical protein